MAKPVYGGWVSFTAHLSLIKGYPIYKIGNKTEKKERDYGYNCKYRNLAPDDAAKLDNILIACIDKNYYKYLPSIKSATIVIHDPTELKEPLLEHLHRFNIITIRKSVQDFLKKKYGLKSKFLVHPFYPVERPSKLPQKTRNLAISRVDFDKNTHIIVEANDKLKKDNQVEIYGALNDLYVYHKLKDTNFKKYYKGRFGKSFDDLMELLERCRFMVDLSTIKNDGGGTQYTFLEAIHMDCILVLNKKWLDGQPTVFVPGKNCLAVSDSSELVKLLSAGANYKASIAKEARKILEPHIRARGW